MSAENTSSQTPVLFCGASKASPGFDTFLANVQKLGNISAVQIESLNQVMVSAKDLDHGLVIMLFATKNDLLPIVNSLTALKKRIDKGVIRAIVYALADHSKTKVPSVLKSKGCTEMLQDGLTQKALVHKLQKHIQIIGTKYKAEQAKTQATKDSVKIESKKQDAGGPDKGKLKFVAALTEPADCWLVKNKKDFRYVRGNWIGEMIGPGPSAGSWVEAGGTKQQPVLRWTPREQAQEDPFVGNKGAWFYAGRKPEFDWKVNRWRFIGEAPSLFFKATDGGQPIVFRFRSSAPGALDLALNSAVAKGKLKAMIETFAQEKVIGADKKKAQTEAEIALEKEKKKKAGDYNDKLTDDEKPADWGDKRGEDEDPDEWGELKEGEEEAASEINDKTGEGEEEEKHDWSGLDVGRGNKFNGGRGVGQGDGDGNKGYKHDEDKAFAKDKNEGTDPNDRTGEGEDGEKHDWSGLDIGRGNKFESGRGLGQGEGGAKGYKYDEDGNKVPLEPGDEPGELEADDPFNLDEPARAKQKGGGEGGKSRGERDGGEDSRSQTEIELDELLGNPAEDTEWSTAENAFEKVTLDIVMKRVDAPGAPDLTDISILERNENDLMLDAPALGFKAGEKFEFAVVLGQPNRGGKRGSTKKKLQVAGELKSSEKADDREIIVVTVAERSRAHLAEIQGVFEARQEELLNFLREAKGA
jgi:hypothetical protein